jgi:carboxymethylenebutenolidase
MPHQQAMLAAWQRHTYAEFTLQDVDASLETMTDNPYVLAVPSGTGASGRAGVRAFYADKFLPHLPPDWEIIPLWQTFGDDRIIDEFVIRFTHTRAMGWMLPGVPATGRRVEIAAVASIQFEGDKIAAERLYWDQATVLSQLGLPNHPAAAAGLGSAARLLQLRTTTFPLNANGPERNPTRLSTGGAGNAN